MPPDANKLNSVFAQLTRFREAFNLLNFFIQPHVIHVNVTRKGTDSALGKKLHTHRTYELSIPLYGKMQYIFPDTTIEVNTGDAIIIPADKTHRWYTVEDSFIFSIMLFISRHGDGAREDMQSFNRAIVTHNYKIPNFIELEQKIKEIITEAEVRKVGFDDKILCLSREFYIEIFRRLQPKLTSPSWTLRMPPKQGDTSESLVELIYYYVQDNISRPIRMREIGAYLGISVNHMNRIFKAQKGETVQSYIVSRRVNYSCELLQNTNRSVKDIAGFVGFDDVNYFCRIFKKNIGLTPTQFRQKL